MKKPRQAVMLIHGIGEQRPMETLRSFVTGIVGTPSAGGRLAYSKPDPHAEGFELRRYRAFDSSSDTDYIEFYWQHLMPVAAWRFLSSWLLTLMWRPAAAMPMRFRILWWICWGAAALFVATAISQLAAWMFGFKAPLPTIPKATGIAALIGAAASYVVRSFVGDAAIYLNPNPRTVEARNDIRAAGVALLDRLQRDGRYDRIVVVGHSLGSVIGYDILNFAWQKESERLRRAVDAGEIGAGSHGQPELVRAEALAALDGLRPDAWNESVRRLQKEQRDLGSRWLVTDFVTVGSPLAHASLLLASDQNDLIRRIGDRELPASPPFREDDAHFSYNRWGPDEDPTTHAGTRIVDHAAVFAVTAWTNLFVPCKWLLHGDLVGGEVHPMLGSGIVDVEVETAIRHGWLAHTTYWSRYKAMMMNAAPLALVRALNLTRSSLDLGGVYRDPAVPRVADRAPD